MFSRSQIRGLVALVAVACLPAFAQGEPTGVAWRGNLDAAKIEAAQSGRLLLLHFYTQSCGPCKLLDQNVLSLPQVGAAVERDYVPVKIDADASPALAHMFRIERVPTEVVLTPQGNIVATLSTPDNPEAYAAQLQNLAKHFRQTTPGASPTSPVAVNSAYASLPTRAPAQSMAMAAPGAIAAPNTQTNPYVNSPPAAAQSQTYLPPTTAAAAAAATVAAAPSATAAAPVANVAPTVPPNAMPQSYRIPGAAGQYASPTGPAPAGVAAAAAGAVAASPQLGAAPTTSVAANPTAPAAVVAATTSGAPPTSAMIRPAQPALPAGAPPVAFDGCCPVTLKTQNRWAPGNTAFGAIHRGRTYLFVDDAARQQFLAAPDDFSPVFAGYDPVLLLDQKQSVPGSRKFGYRYGGSFYLFASKDSMDRFQASPQTYAAGVRQAMARVDGSSDAVLRR